MNSCSGFKGSGFMELGKSQGIDGITQRSTVSVQIYCNRNDHFNKSPGLSKNKLRAYFRKTSDIFVEFKAPKISPGLIFGFLVLFPNICPCTHVVFSALYQRTCGHVAYVIRYTHAHILKSTQQS